MLTLTEQFIFTRPFNPDDETNRSSSEVKERLDTVYSDADVLNTAKKMLDIFLHKKECLVHGDLHTGSIMVKSEDARMIDMEFAFVGPASFDLGLLIANYIFSYYRNMSLDEGNGVRRKVAHRMIDACKVTGLWLGAFNSFPKQRILDSSKLKEFVDDSFEIGENVRKFSKQIENTVGKGEIAHYEQFLLFPQCFQKTCTADT